MVLTAELLRSLFGGIFLFWLIQLFLYFGLFVWIGDSERLSRFLDILHWEFVVLFVGGIILMFWG